MGKMVITSADDGCDDIYCISCHARFQIRFSKVMFCPICGVSCDAFIERKYKERQESYTADKPINTVNWAIMCKRGENSTPKKVWATPFDIMRNKRENAIARLKEFREDAKELAEMYDPEDYVPHVYYIVKEHTHA